MKKVFLGINIILLWITIWHFYRFPITENMSLSLHNKKIYRRLIFNTIDSLVKDRNDLLFNMNFGGEEQDDAGRAYVKGLMKNRDAWIGYVYSFDEIMEESPAYASNPPNGDELAVTKYHLTKEEIMRKFNLKKLSLKNPRFFVDKFGTDRELSNWHKYTYELPQSKLKDEKDIKKAKNIEKRIKRRRILWLVILILCLKLQRSFLVKNKKETIHND